MNILSQSRLAAAGLILLVGCSSDPNLAKRPATATASGIVTLGGQPVEGATVTLIDVSSAVPGQAAQGHSSVGVTGPDGRFKLTTFESGDGAVPGEYAVSVTKFEVPKSAGSSTTSAADTDGGSLEGNDYKAPSEAGRAAANGPKNLLPAKYANARASGLKATIQDGTNDLTFALEK